MHEEQYQGTFLHWMADSGIFSLSWGNFSLQMLHCTTTWIFPEVAYELQSHTAHTEQGNGDYFVRSSIYKIILID